MKIPLCTVCVPGAPKDHKGAVGALKLKLQVVGSCHVGVGRSIPRFFERTTGAFNTKPSLQQLHCHLTDFFLLQGKVMHVL